MASMHCGLDFGTSNSTIAVAPGNAPAHLLPLEDGRVTIPSAIFYAFDVPDVFFGRRAMEEYVSGTDGRLLRSLKSMLGTPLFADVTRIKRRVMPFSDILGAFVAELKLRAEGNLGEPIADVVVGRPVQFVDGDAAADSEAQEQLEATIRRQGFRHVEFQFEPIAAALDYEQQTQAEELALVVDIGGGTSDFSIVRVSPERARAADRQSDILAAAGVHIGGTDFDRLLSMLKVMPLLGYRTATRDHKRPLPSAPYYELATWHRINRLYTARMLQELRSTRLEAAFPQRVAQLIAIVEDRQGHRLAGAVEAAKIALTDQQQTSFRFESRDVDIATGMDQADLTLALEDAVGRIFGTIEQVLSLAGLRHGDIQTLILTGGSTQVPAIAAPLAAAFPMAKRVATDAFGSVGLGLALEARRRFG
jgi:hypothetical chaperone protein